MLKTECEASDAHIRQSIGAGQWVVSSARFTSRP